MRGGWLRGGIHKKGNEAVTIDAEALPHTAGTTPQLTATAPVVDGGLGDVGQFRGLLDVENRRELLGPNRIGEHLADLFLAERPKIGLAAWGVFSHCGILDLRMGMALTVRRWLVGQLSLGEVNSLEFFLACGCVVIKQGVESLRTVTG